MEPHLRRHEAAQLGCHVTPDLHDPHQGRSLRVYQTGNRFCLVGFKRLEERPPHVTGEVRGDRVVGVAHRRGVFEVERAEVRAVPLRAEVDIGLH